MTIAEKKRYDRKIEELELLAETEKNPQPITDFVLANGLWRNTELKDIPGEEWGEFVDYEDIYRCSTMGRIMSLARASRRLSNKNQILKQKITTRGYLEVAPCKDGKRTSLLVHRQIGKTFISNPLSLPEVNHTKGCKLDNRIIRLEWITSSDNQKHAYGIGVMRQDGEFHATSKLNWDKVREIRRLYLSGVPAADLAEKYGVDKCHIRNICYNVFWKDKNYVWDTRNRKRRS